MTWISSHNNKSLPYSGEGLYTEYVNDTIVIVICHIDFVWRNIVNFHLQPFSSKVANYKIIIKNNKSISFKFICGLLICGATWIVCVTLDIPMTVLREYMVVVCV